MYNPFTQRVTPMDNLNIYPMAQKVNFDLTAEFPIGMKLKVKLLISRGRLWPENVLVGEFGVLSENFRVGNDEFSAIFEFRTCRCLLLLAAWSRLG